MPARKCKRPASQSAKHPPAPEKEPSLDELVRPDAPEKELAAALMREYHLTPQKALQTLYEAHLIAACEYQARHGGSLHAALHMTAWDEYPPDVLPLPSEIIANAGDALAAALAELKVLIANLEASPSYAHRPRTQRRSDYERQVYRRVLQAALARTILGRGQSQAAVRSTQKPGKAEADSAEAQTRWQPITVIQEQIKVLGPTELSILLLGETGTGKEFYAQQIHKASLRRKSKLTVINCATLPKDLIDSELFGYIKGAFTGAVQDSLGKIREAEGGTVFLDEIGELPAEGWGKLLRFLQSKEVEPVKGKTQIVDVRILAATNKPHLVPDVARNRFNLTLCLPPLREHREDIPALAREFFGSAARSKTEAAIAAKAEGARSTTRAKRLATDKRTYLRFLTMELNRLRDTAFSWPGNVRQLKKAVETAVWLHSSGRYLKADEVIASAEQILP